MCSLTIGASRHGNCRRSGSRPMAIPFTAPRRTRQSSSAKLALNHAASASQSGQDQSCIGTATGPAASTVRPRCCRASLNRWSHRRSRSSAVALACRASRVPSDFWTRGNGKAARTSSGTRRTYWYTPWRVVRWFETLNSSAMLCTMLCIRPPCKHAGRAEAAEIAMLAGCRWGRWRAPQELNLRAPMFA